MKRASLLALLISLLAVAASAWVATDIFENIPHLEDELAYVWQARMAAQLRLSMPSPVETHALLTPFVVDYQGLRFGKYPPGWPAMLALGELTGLRAWVNPLLAGLAVWLLFRLGQRLHGDWVGLLAAGLLTSSPFFLVNAGSLLAHVWGLVLTLIFALAWLDAFAPRAPLTPRHAWLVTVLAALALGLLALTRPFTAVLVAAPFAVHGAIALLRGPNPVRLRLLAFVLLAGGLSALIFVWQFAVTGDFHTNPYTLWWPYDRIGFGPGVGVRDTGHTLYQGWVNTRFSLKVGASDLFGWARLSWIFLPFGLLGLLWRGKSAWRLRHEWRTWLIVFAALALIAGYMAYWVGAWLFGPRYYFEALPALCLVSALGIAALAGYPAAPGESYTPAAGWLRLRRLGMVAVLALLVAANLRFYLPPRLDLMRNLYTINAGRLEPFLTEDAQKLAPALFLVETERWMPYGALLDLQAPDFSSPFVFALNLGPRANASLTEIFSERRVFYYYPDEPYRFYTLPRPARQNP